MKIYVKFITSIFLKSFLYVFVVILSLVFILNLLGELDFFREIKINSTFLIYLALLNSPAMIFEMLPFIMLISSQLFFIKLYNNNELDIFKYSGLKNSNILIILSIISLLIGVMTTLVFYNFSSNMKNFYLEAKSKYSSDGKYLAVVTKNGLWIRDIIDGKILVINSRKIEGNFLIDNFITEFDSKYNVKSNIKSEKIEISNKEWLINDARIYNKNTYEIEKVLKISTNFDLDRIQGLYSNLTSLNLFELYELRQNYKKLNYSLTDVNLQILKLLVNPLLLLLITLFSSIIMLKIKHVTSATFKISLGLFLSVIIYYMNNFFLVLGGTERISLSVSIFGPLFLLTLSNFLLLNKINEK